MRPWENNSLAGNSLSVRENFERWFGNSQIVNGDGDPAIVFHGSSSKENFDSFEEKRQGQTAGVPGGYFFTNTADTAMDVYGWRGKVIQVYLRMAKPLTLKEYFELTRLNPSEELDGGRHNPTNYFDENSEVILEFAKSNGYDGLLFKDDSGDEYAADLFVVFDPRQIKSADANNGVFDPDSASLTDEPRARILEQMRP